MIGVSTSLKACANEAVISPREPSFCTRASCSVASASSWPRRCARSLSHRAHAPSATTLAASATMTLVVSAVLPPKIRPLDSLVGQQSLTRAFERDRPILEHVRSVGQPERAQDVLLDEQHRRALAVDPGKIIKDRPDHDRGEPQTRLLPH